MISYYKSLTNSLLASSSTLSPVFSISEAFLVPPKDGIFIVWA